MSHVLFRLHREVKLSCPQELEAVGLLLIFSGTSRRSQQVMSPVLTVLKFRINLATFSDVFDRYLCFLVRCNTLRIPAHEKRIKDIKLLLKSMWLVRVIIFSCLVFYNENQGSQILRKPLINYSMGLLSNSD